MKGHDWTDEKELLATLCELIDFSNRMFLAANTKKGTKIPEPIKIPRPFKREEEEEKKGEKSMFDFFKRVGKVVKSGS